MRESDTLEIKDALGLDDVPEIIDEAMLEEALAFLGELAKGLFPEGDAGLELLTWPDRDDRGEQGTDSPGSMEERVRAAERRFLTLVEQIPAVTFMAVLGEGENDVYVSPHIEQMLGYSQEEWLSNPFLWYYRLHPDDRSLWNEEFTRGCRAGGPFRAECRFLARDDRVVWVHGEARLVKDEHGRPQFLQGVAFDITESKRAQELMVESAVRDAKLQEELEIARRVQTSLLPKEPVLPGLEIAAITVPADDVGGDYYDVRETRDGGWLTIGDVSGHGLNAGLVMLMVQSAACAITRAWDDATPSELLALLNEVIYENLTTRLQRQEYVTLSVLHYTRDGRVVFAGAHQDILVLRAQTFRVERIPTPGPWIGVRSSIDVIATDQALSLHDGDMMILFTDGVIEAMDGEGKLFEIQRLCDAIEEVADGTPREVLDHVLARLRSFSQVQNDDVTLLVARYSAA